MEEKKRVNALTIILFILLLIVVGVICYLLGNNKLEGNNQNNNENSIEEKNDVNNSLNTQILQIYPERSLAVLYNGEVYVNIDGYYDPSDSINNYYGSDAIRILQNVTRKKYVTYTFDNVNILDYENNQFVGMKLDVKGVKSIYAFISGQDYLCNYGLMLLTENKEVYSISLKSLINGETSVTRIESLENIVTIETNYGMAAGTYAIDSNGNKQEITVPSDFKVC